MAYNKDKVMIKKRKSIFFKTSIVYPPPSFSYKITQKALLFENSYDKRLNRQTNPEQKVLNKYKIWS